MTPAWEVQLQWWEEARQREAEQRQELRGRSERVRRENAEAQARREAKGQGEAAVEAPAEQPQVPGGMSPTDMARMLGTEAPLEA
jgi:hypothetical protein